MGKITRAAALTVGSWVLFVAIETATQVVFKLGGATLDPGAGIVPMVLRALMTPTVMIGFALYFCAFLCWMTILKDIDLGRAFPMTASVYFGTVSGGVLIFHEHLTPLRIAGVVVIVAGIALLAFDRNSPKDAEQAAGEAAVGPVHG